MGENGPFPSWEMGEQHGGSVFTARMLQINKDDHVFTACLAELHQFRVHREGQPELELSHYLGIFKNWGFIIVFPYIFGYVR